MNNFTQPMIPWLLWVENKPRVKRCPKASSCCEIPIALMTKIEACNRQFATFDPEPGG